MTLQPSPCPFCGGINIVREGYHLCCWACGADGPDADTGDEESLIEAWNTRAALASQAQPEQPKRDSVHLTSDAVVCAATAQPVAMQRVRMLTEDELLQAIQSRGREMHGRIALTFESGPYDIDRPTLVADNLADAIQRKFIEVNRLLAPGPADNASLVSNEKEESVAALPEQPSDAQMLDWLEQQHWHCDDLFDLMNDWRTPDGKRHPQGLRSAIRAAMAADQGAPHG